MLLESPDGGGHGRLVVDHVDDGVHYLLPVVGHGYYFINCVIDNTSALAWINKLFCSVADDPSASTTQLLRMHIIRLYSNYQRLQKIVVTSSFIKSEQNILPDALTRPDLTSVFTSAIVLLQEKGLTAHRLRLPSAWGQQLINQALSQ